MMNSKKDAQEIEQLTQEFAEKGIVTTSIWKGGLGQMSQRLETLVAMPEVEAVIISTAQLAILMDKENPADVVHKINYIASLNHAKDITLLKAGKEIPNQSTCVCHFDDFSDSYIRTGLKYRKHTRQRS